MLSVQQAIKDQNLSAILHFEKLLRDHLDSIHVKVGSYLFRK